MRMLALPLVGLLVSPLGLVGCSNTRGFCEASADCDTDVFGFEIDAAGDSDDDVNVCIVNQDTQLRALRANEEDECHALADALDAYYACVAAEFADSKDGCDAVNDDCDDELDDVRDANADIDGNECTASED